MPRSRSSSQRPSDLPKDLLNWYDRHRRVLPWRAGPGQNADPYHVWLSEIMLQQTTVTTVAPYFRRFLARWPRIEDLANAQESEVLSAWAGLGYYARARNLHACARIVAGDHGGKFPQTEDGLRALPGIGAYTAAAITAIAFGRPAAAVDGNIERVMTRLFAIETPLPAAKPQIRESVARLIPNDRPGDMVQALMDLGATICTPRNPACALCPWNHACKAKALGLATSLPIKAAKRARPVKYGTAYLAMDPQGAILLRRRPRKGLLGGMMEVPSTEWTLSNDKDLPCPIPLQARWRTLNDPVIHIFTHFELRLRVLVSEVSGQAPPQDCEWVAPAALSQAALPSLFRKVIDAARPTPPRQRNRRAASAA